jgi:hypothetical protein
MAGSKRDQKLAAIITPAAKPSMPSSSRRFISLNKKTAAAPRAVTPQVKHVARSAWRMGDC